MKRIYILILLFAGITYSHAQSGIAGYEYWFNDNFAGKTTTSVTSTPQLLINQTISTSGLINGINLFNFRSFNNLGEYSSIVSHFFYKTSEVENNQERKIVAYEYWLDNDHTNAIQVSTPAQQQLNINTLISMSTIINGLHNFSIRFKDTDGMWSSVTNQFFYKLPIQNTNDDNKIVAYRYWFNDDFAQAVNVTLSTPLLIHSLAKNISLAELPTGQHSIHFQFKDANEKWSVVTSDNIEKTSALSIIENSFDNTLLAYPNPFTERIQIDLKETFNVVKISIHDINGKTIHQSTFENQQIFDLNFDEPAGIYLMTIESGIKKATLRIIKN